MSGKRVARWLPCMKSWEDLWERPGLEDGVCAGCGVELGRVERVEMLVINGVEVGSWGFCEDCGSKLEALGV